MRIRILLLPSSMPLTVHLCLVVTSALLLFLCSSTSGVGTQYEDCLSYGSTHCGDFEFSYPFGKNGSGCGDTHFQLDCPPPGEPGPWLNIRGKEYLILNGSSLVENGNHSMKIINSNIWETKLCGLPVGNNQSMWDDDSPFFHLAAGYIIVTIWKDCDNYHGLPMPTPCEDSWYYKLGQGLDPQGTLFCKTHFQLPIQEQLKDNDNTLWEGFEITWNDKPSNGNGGPNKLAITIGCSIGGAALIAIVVVLFLRFYAKRRKTLTRGFASGDMEAAILPRRNLGNLPIFSYEELRQATNCFHEENELGDGGFGSVYLGKLMDGRTVAVKRLYQDNSRRLEQFINEVQIFSTLNHPRVVRLYGCTSPESPELLLVYEFVSNGTLADHLHGDRRGPRGLPWGARLNIAYQTAEALAFLHSVDPPIFHRDVKSSNILLDENFNVKVADFGLCRLVPVNASHVTTVPQGTPGYVDPEYHQCYQLTEKSDVYSFGVVLMEIISAKLAVDINRNRKEIGLANMAKSKIQEGALHELVDPQLEIEMNQEVKVTVTAVAELAFRCLASERDDRPHMKEVVSQLMEIRQTWETSTSPGEQQWGSFSNIKQPLSPMSVQDKWSSISSTPNSSE